VSSTLQRWLSTRAPGSVLLIRLMVGGVFLAEGIQKFLFPATLGVGRFAKIGIPAPEFFAPFVGAVEIVCGALLLLGLATRLAAVPLLIDILVAIATTKLPMLAKSGFWSTVHEARTDACMLLGLLFLLAVGAGRIALDARSGDSIPARGRDTQRLPPF
jgi:putative oxidoreductase